MDSPAFMIASITAGVSGITAIIAVVVTYILTKKREHEADWRKLKFSQYQEFVLALSGVVRERATTEGHRRYADAVNSMALVAPSKVISALRAFQIETSHINNNRSDERHDRLLDILLREMREDIHPNHSAVDSSFSFHLFGLPPEARND